MGVQYVWGEEVLAFYGMEGSGLGRRGVSRALSFFITQDVSFLPSRAGKKIREAVNAWNRVRSKQTADGMENYIILLIVK